MLFALNGKAIEITKAESVASETTSDVASWARLVGVSGI